MHPLQAAQLDPIFADLGEDAMYIPPHGTAQPVRLIFVSSSEVMGASGYPELRPVIHVLQAALSRPVLGGVFRIGTAEDWSVDKPPELRDGVWAVIVRRMV
jgi:hypothetical protein